MTERTGVLQNSPLIFALASIRFAAWPLMTKKIDEIHDELREITPLIQHIQVQQLGIGGQAVPTERPLPSAWMLMSSDRTCGFHLAPDQLLFFSRNYRRYADFQETLGKGMDVLLKHMRFMDITNLGVRYVDHIKLRAGERFQDYVTERLLPPELAALERLGGIMMGVYQSGEAGLRVHCVTQPGIPGFPQDLIDVLAMTQEPGKPFRLEQLNGNDMLLDMDAIHEYPTPTRMDTKTILPKLDKLHGVANTFFRHENICTEHAFKVWKGEE